jgi:S-DNA-T family DNA segregation ATPase FtsK/SpoIIIE
MHYLTHTNEITAAIETFSSAKILWLDTEIADWQTSNPRLSLIQVLSSPHDRSGNDAYILDVLNQPNLIQEFIQRIMLNQTIEKVFHNASFDLRYLGQAQAKNVTCTLKLARQIGKHRLNTSNLKLKTLATELCQFSNVDASEQGSEWGQRDLSPSQLYYAAMDVVYLAAVHRSLLNISNPQALTQIDAIFAQTMSCSKSSNASPKPITAQLSPTKVRTAFECPRLFYLGQRQGLSTLFIPQDGQVGVGKPFHAMADRLIDYLQQNATELNQVFQGPPNELEANAIAAIIQHQFYAQVFFPYLTTLQEKHPEQANGLLRIWQGISSLIGQLTRLLVANRSRLTAEQLVSQTFPRHNRKLRHTFILPNGASQTVIGEYDCLVFDATKQRLCVLELKTYAPLDPTAQLAQAALYSYLLWTQEQRPIDAAVYCVLPEFQTFDYAWEQLENTVHQLIPHKLQQMQEWLTWQDTQPNPPPEPPQAAHLCSICPQQTPCQTIFGNNIVPPETATTTAETIELTTAEVMGQKLVETFSAFDVGTIYAGAAIGQG